MAEKDLFDQLIAGYEFMLGTLPNREQFKAALQQTINEEDVRVILLCPVAGPIPMAKLEKKAERIGIPAERLHAIVRRLVPEGLIASYILPERKGQAIAYPTPAPLVDMRHKGRVVQRGDIVSMTEMQVRKPEAAPMRQASAVYFNAMTQDAAQSIPTKTPYFRVIPYEPSIKEKPSYGKITINVPIPDPTEVLPFDTISEMVKNEPVVALADCYCRRTQQILGNACQHPTETCLYFNGLALLQVEAGRAHMITPEKALEVLRISEEAGLVHNVSNCAGGISTICNCCTCSCGAMKSMKMRRRNASTTSRFISQQDVEKCTLCSACVRACPMEAISIREQHLVIEEEACIGCGLCISRCPQGALSMALRQNQPKIYETGRKLTRRITTEAFTGLVKKKITGHY